jgi:hypothetical protein
MKADLADEILLGGLGLLGVTLVGGVLRHASQQRRSQPMTTPQGGQIRAFGYILPAPLVIHTDDDFPSEGRRQSVTQIVVHENVGGDGDVHEDEPGEKDDATERTLRHKGLGLHFVVGVDDKTKQVSVVQHNDLWDIQHHTGGPVNDLSVGVEIINPYYNPKNHWQRVIEAPWAHKGRYVLPLAIQCEALWGIIIALTDATARRAPGMKIPKQFWGIEAGNRFRMGELPKRFARSTPGILAHHHYGHHADGCFPVLYCVLRAGGRSPDAAYQRAVALATGNKGLIQL